VDVAAVLLLPLLRWTQDTEAGPCGHVPYILALHWLPLRDFGTICLPCFAPFLLLRKERGRFYMSVDFISLFSRGGPVATSFHANY